MKQQEAERILNETFNKQFDLSRFGIFIKEIFKGKCHVNINSKNLFPYKQFEEGIKSFKQIGEYTNGRNSLVILAVELKKTDSIEKARTMQRNFVGTWLLKGGVIPKDGALVAFYGENPDEWRFSFVKMDYKFDENGKAIKELTPAKRLSFLVGKHEPNHTCKKQFLKLLLEEEITPSFKEIEEAFGVENVTKEFFDLYKKRFFELRDSIDKILENSPKIKKDFELKQINSTEFAKKLLGQIVFLYFLQKKGWLGVKKESDGGFGEWGTGPKNFMTKLFNKEIVNYDNFFDEVLEPLFYEALAKERDDSYFSKFNCKIPFLNGGLFEPIKEYDWVNTKIEIDNEIFDRILTQTFDKFNFTIKEDEPLEREVAVDPEMLGKVFENLLDVKDRKSKGAFYTPREIVHYMCQQSLINYLETNTKIPREDLEKFILKGDLALDYLRRVTDSHKNDVSEEFMLPSSISKNTYEIEELLKKIKICDPAVGSGAFPVGMMNEIVKARQILRYFIGSNDGSQKTDYDLKRETIENCLYGVDIEPSAVDITKLRFWLSLIVDENNIQDIKPLPNLDNKIMCGNSLIEEFEGVKLFDESILFGVEKEKKEKQSNLDKFTEKKRVESQIKFDKLRQLQKDYFNEQNGPKKKQIMNEIESLEWEFIEATLKEQNNEDALKKLEQYKRSKSKPFFLWKLYFSDVFQRQNPGFDVVIGNPPYVRVQNISKNDLQSIKNSYLTATGKFDLYIIFVEKGLNISRERASLFYIMPNKFFTNNYGVGIRSFISEHEYLSQIINFGEHQVFDTATTYSCIFGLKKENNDKYKYYDISSKLEAQSFFNMPNFILKSSSSLNKKNWIIKEEQDTNLFSKLVSNNISLGDCCDEIFQGLVSGGDKFFYLHLIKELQKTFILRSLLNHKQYEIEKDICYYLLKGSEVKRYSKINYSYVALYPYIQKEGKTKILSEKEIETLYPLAWKYLNDFKEPLSKRGSKGMKYATWYSFWCERNLEKFTKEKVLTQVLSKNASLTLDITHKTLFVGGGNAGVYGIIPKKDFGLKFILAILNSRLSDYYLKNNSTIFRGGFYSYAKRFIENIPIKSISQESQKPFIELVDKILSITRDEDYLKNTDKQAKVKAYEKQIDKLVYELYELTPEEIKIVEEFGK